LHAQSAGSDALGEVVSTFAPGARPARRRRAPQLLGAVSRVLWRAAPVQAGPSEFGAQWARYSHLKTITRREGLHQHFLLACLEKLRRGERAVVATWQDRPVALLWLCRDPQAELHAAGFTDTLPSGAALVSDAYLALDLRGSPRREQLPSTLLTFLAAEDVTALFGVHDTRHPAPLLMQCGGRLQPLARRLTVHVLRWKRTFERRFPGTA
jgi:hypothetical protein